MEADWELEIGGDAPIIDACWDGFVDLCANAERALLFPESRQLPGLAEALTRLNATVSRIWTSKCDVWVPDKLDYDELDAHPGEESSALACYIDLLPRTPHEWSVDEAVVTCKTICARLRSSPLRCCRVDLIIRRAWITQHRHDVGITAYLTACGSAPEEAQATLRTALSCLAQAVLPAAAPSTLQ